MRKKLLIITGICLALWACKKEEPRYYDGELFFEVTDTTTFKTVYAQVLSPLNIHVSSFGVFNLIIGCGSDSIPYYAEALRKSYLSATLREIKNTYPEISRDSVAEIAMIFKAFGKTEGLEWFAMMDSLKIIELPKLYANKTKLARVVVPTGKEEEYISKLKKYPFVINPRRVQKP